MNLLESFQVAIAGSSDDFSLCALQYKSLNEKLSAAEPNNKMNCEEKSCKK